MTSHSTPDQCTSAWFNYISRKDTWTDDFLLSCMYFPDELHQLGDHSKSTQQEATIIVCYFYVPAPLGNGGWNFINTRTHQGRSCFFFNSVDYKEFVDSTYPIIKSNLDFFSICEVVHECKEKKPLGSAKSDDVNNLRDIVENELAKQLNDNVDCMLIECTIECRRKVPDIESRLFILFDRHQLGNIHQTAQIKVSTFIDPSILLKLSEDRSEPWVNKFLDRILKYDSAQLSELMQCFFASQWCILGDITYTWPLPTLNFNLGYWELTARLEFLLRLLLRAQVPDMVLRESLLKRSVEKTWRISDEEYRQKLASLKISLTERNLFKDLWLCAAEHTKTRIKKKGHWKVEDMSLYRWGMFKDNNKLHISFASNITVLYGLSDSGKTTVLLALETACLLMTSGLSSSEIYHLVEDNHKLSFPMRNRLIKLLERVSRHMYTWLEAEPIFTISFTHSSNTKITFRLVADESNFNSIRYDLKQNGKEDTDDIRDFLSNVSAEMESASHLCSMGAEFKQMNERFTLDELFEPLLCILGYEKSLRDIRQFLNDFFPGKDVSIGQVGYSLKSTKYEHNRDHVIYISTKIGQTADYTLTRCGDGFVNILQILVQSLTLEYRPPLGLKLLLLDEPDRSIDRPTIAMLVKFLSKFSSSVQCIIATHAHELIAHTSNFRQIAIRHFTPSGIIEADVESVLNSLNCADTFRLMRYLPYGRILRAFLVEGVSDHRVLTAAIAVVGTKQQKQIWSEGAYSIFYNQGRVKIDQMHKLQEGLKSIVYPPVIDGTPVFIREDNVRIFALVDQDIHVKDDAIKEERQWKTEVEHKAGNFAFYQWKRRCLESYLFDKVEIFDAMPVISNKIETKYKKPSAVFYDAQQFKSWYDDLVRVVKQKVTESCGNKADVHETTGKNKKLKNKKEQMSTKIEPVVTESIDVEAKLREHFGVQNGSADFGIYQEDIKQATLSYFQQSTSVKPPYLLWFENNGISIDIQRSFHVHIANTIKSAMNRGYDATLEKKIEEWFKEKDLPYPYTDEILKSKERQRLLHWFDGHKIVPVLKKKFQIDLEDYDCLEKLFKKTVQSGDFDEGIEEIKEMLNALFQWLQTW